MPLKTCSNCCFENGCLRKYSPSNCRSADVLLCPYDKDWNKQATKIPIMWINMNHISATLQRPSSKPKTNQTFNRFPSGVLSRMDVLLRHLSMTDNDGPPNIPTGWDFWRCCLTAWQNGATEQGGPLVPNTIQAKVKNIDWIIQLYQTP